MKKLALLAVTFGLLLGNSGLSLALEAHGDARAFYNWQEATYLLLWEVEYSSNDIDIYAQRFSLEGERLGHELAIAYTGKNEFNPRLAFNSSAQEYLLVWEHEYAPGDIDIHACRLDLDGQKIGSEFAIVQSGANEIDANILFHPVSEQYLVTWAQDLPRAGSVQLLRSVYADGMVAEEVYPASLVAAEPIAEEWIESLPVPQPVPDPELWLAMAAVSVQNPHSLVSVLPVPIPDPNSMLSVLPVPVPDPKSWISATPIPLPDPNSWRSVLPVPVP